VAVDLQAILGRGDKELIDLLEYCVRSVQMEPVFVFLVGEYQAGPTALKALALYEVFCAPQALGRIHAAPVLPPLNFRVLASLQPLQRWREQIASPDADPSSMPPAPLPAKFLFDFIVDHLESEPSGILRRVSQSYDPGLTPVQNLPGGKTSPAQRAFVERVWEPILRPRLVAAGFRRIANIA
jgi:hypothetical protein